MISDRQMDKIKVMQITHDLNIGGLQRVVVDLAKSLDKEKFDVSVCALREGGPFERELKDAGIEVIRMPSTGHRADYFRFWKLYKVMMEKKPSIIHTHNTEPLTDATPAALLARIPVRVHTDHARHFPDKRRYMFSEWLLSHFISQFVAVSEHTKENLVRHEKIRPNKIKVVFNGISGEKYNIRIDKEKKKAELGVGPSRTPILGVAARLTKQKGITYLLKAMKLLCKDFSDILLLIAGEGELWDELHAEVNELDIERNVLFLGPRLDIHEILQVQDIFVLPSLYEGLPLVLLEAMAASLPIVAADVGGVRQAVQDGINGLLLRPEDPGALYDAIKRLIKNRAMRADFSKNSLEVFQKQFTLERMVKTYEKLYSDCLEAI
jgi:glycosyltransferase involved in cell wall biosynthesis